MLKFVSLLVLCRFVDRRPNA